METRQVDIAIIGAGTAGLNAVREAQKSGRSWLLIDHGPYGTTCARVGCMPSKLLIAAADAAHAARNAGTFGIRIPSVGVDGASVMQRLRRERDRFVQGVVDDTESLPAASRRRGTARFIDANTLEIVPTAPWHDPALRLTATATVVAAGSSPAVPGVFDAIRDRVITSDTVFELATLPRRLAVVGTGIVGLELGQALSRLGTTVTLLDRSGQPGPGTDPVVLERIRTVLSRTLDLRMNAEITSAVLEDDGARVAWRIEGADHSAVFDAVLVAAGRPPNLDPLDLSATGLNLDDRGQPPWNRETGQCADLPIFLAGDVDGHRPLLHEAGDEGRIAGENAARWPDVNAQSRRTALSIVFTDPQIGLVGTPYADLSATGHSIGRVDFREQGRARVMAVNEGVLRVYARHPDCVLVGAEMFGPRMEHLAHLLAWAVQQQVTVQRLLEMPVYHPTLEEGLRSALRDLARALEIEDQCRSQDRTESPGM